MTYFMSVSTKWISVQVWSICFIHIGGLCNILHVYLPVCASISVYSTDAYEFK